MFQVRRIAAFLCVVFATLLMTGTAEAGYAHFIYDTKTGKVLTAENADEINHPASLTKMMTLYMTFEALRDGRLKWNQDIVMTPNAASKIPTKLGIQAGRTLTVREAVLGMIVRSANDAAAAVGDQLGGSEERFAAMMTQRARRLGMSRTVFRNASGLPDDEQVTTARDMATLAMSLIRDFPREYALFSEKNMQFRGKRLRGHNNLMYRYPGMDGIKTGFTNASGYNIASAVNINGRRVIGVVLGGRSARVRDDRMAELLDEYVPGNNVSAAVAANGRSASSDFETSDARVSEPSVKQPRVNAAPSTGRLAALQSQKRSGEGEVPLAFAAPTLPQRKEITIETSAAPRPASMGNLYTLQQPKPVPANAAQVYRIQIAAAGSLEQASDKLGKAMPLLSKDFASVTPQVESYTESGKEMFRARFIGFADGSAATRACSVLQSKSITCFVVR